MTNPNTLTQNYEAERNLAEAFLPLEQMMHMTRDTLAGAGRIDEKGVIQPIEVERNLHGAQWLIGPKTDSVWRNDIFVPTPAESKEYVETNEHGLETSNQVSCLDMSSVLYGRLTGQQNVQVSVEQADSIAQDIEQFETTISKRPEYSVELKQNQIEDAFHIRSAVGSIPDFDKTRIYVPSGLRALEVADAVFASGASMDYAKIWIPPYTPGEQSVRNDAPIFEVTNFAQLGSVMSALRSLAAEGKLPEGPKPMAGYEPDGLPGVYIGQMHKHSSFNARMKKLFGNGIQQAASEVKLHAGDIVNEAVVTTIAVRARELAQATAAKTGTNPTNHAFLEGQPINRILEIINR